MNTFNWKTAGRCRLAARRVFAASLTVLLLLAACGPPAPVVQGKVVAVADGGKAISVQDETRPDAQPVTLQIGEAEIGATPAEGDQVRVVYRRRGEVNVALRVMNITRQKARESSGH